MDEVPVARLCLAGGNQNPSQTTLGNFHIATCKKITTTLVKKFGNCPQCAKAAFRKEYHQEQDR
ncbi:hypothetical protein [Qipengyuania aquimaris]|uniref:Uncharacterized protein n=1 Tax=Qipengyuania aquimaris TaxID=255984 RepID=A0A9Q3XDC7_9SPHN|nr:hypothetical protein [Qipengyuania aquimaris]MBY6218379.1 hypothetical protein [Qipengyuania aquimaris]